MVHCVHQQTDISSHAVNTYDVCHNHQHLSITLRYQSKLQLCRCRCLTQLTKYTRHVTYTLNHKKCDIVFLTITLADLRRLL